MNKLSFTNFFSFFGNSNKKKPQTDYFSDTTLDMNDALINATINDIERGKLLKTIEMMMDITRDKNDEVYNFLIVKKGRIIRKTQDRNDKVITEKEFDDIIDGIQNPLLQLLKVNLPNQQEKKGASSMDIIPKRNYKTN